MEIDFYWFWSGALGGVFSCITFVTLIYAMDRYEHCRLLKRIERECKGGFTPRD